MEPPTLTQKNYYFDVSVNLSHMYTCGRHMGAQECVMYIQLHEQICSILCGTCTQIQRPEEETGGGDFLKNSFLDELEWSWWLTGPQHSSCVLTTPKARVTGMATIGVLYVVVIWKKMGSKGSDTTRRCVLVGVSMVLLEEVCQCGGGFWGLIYAQDTTQCLRPFPVASMM